MMSHRHLTAFAAGLIVAGIASTAVAQDAAMDQAAMNCFNAQGATHNLVRGYYDCIRQNAARLEPSGAQPDQIATAAASSCAALLTDIDWRFDACQTLFVDVIGDTYAATARRTVQEGAQTTAVSTVIEMRAARATATN